MIDFADPGVREMLRIVGTFHDYDGLVEGMKARMREVGMTNAKLDEVTGFADGYSAKLLGDSQVRQFTLYSFLTMSRVLGIEAVFVVNPALAKDAREHWGQPTDNRIRASKNPRIGEKVLKRVRGAVFANHASAIRARIAPEQRKANASKAGKARWKGVSKAARKQLMQAAAASRWKSPRGIARAERKSRTRRSNLSRPKPDHRPE